MAFKIRQNPFFGLGSAPDPVGGAHDASPDPLVGWRGDTPPIPYPTRHQPTFGARHAPLPQNSSQIHTPMIITQACSAFCHIL